MSSAKQYKHTQCRPDIMHRREDFLQDYSCDLQGKRIKDVVNRMHVAVPQARDTLSRPPVIPAGVAHARAARDAGYKPPTEKDLQVYFHSHRATYVRFLAMTCLCGGDYILVQQHHLLSYLFLCMLLCYCW